MVPSYTTKTLPLYYGVKAYLNRRGGSLISASTWYCPFIYFQESINEELILMLSVVCFFNLKVALMRLIFVINMQLFGISSKHYGGVLIRKVIGILSPSTFNLLSHLVGDSCCQMNALSNTTT